LDFFRSSYYYGILVDKSTSQTLPLLFDIEMKNDETC